ncbi:MAG: hypothetical protein AB7S68_27270 [Polyangiaceae bacterium]
MNVPSLRTHHDLADPTQLHKRAGSPLGVMGLQRVVGVWLALCLAAVAASGCSSSDPASQTPVKEGCEADSECPPDTPFCSEGACYECRGSLDCAPGERCTAGACVAGPPCGAGCASGVCNTLENRCVECLATEDCSGGEVCRDQHCVPHCDSTADCNGVGVCDTVVGACVGCQRPTDCPSGRFCQDERCEPQVCTPSESKCEGNAVRHCDGTGSGWVDPIACGDGQTCVEDVGHAYCEVQRCVPGEVTCDLERVVKCRGDGLALEVAEDCVANAQACSAGECTPVTCTPGETFCLGSEYRSCRSDGSSSDLIQTCTSDQHCNDKAGCVLNVCSPGESTCVGNTLHVCDSDGSGYDGGTSCGSNAECINGVCETHACTPDAYFCDGGNVQRCNVDGLSWNLAESCEPGGSCANGESTCRPPLSQSCPPNEWYCGGAYLYKCDANGHNYSESQRCKYGEYCIGNACVPVNCTPGSNFCRDGNAYQCSADGMSDIVFDVCTPQEYCSTIYNHCMAKECVPGATSCAGNYARTCNALGSGYVQVSCSNTGQVCVDGACKTVACTPLSKRCQDSSTAEACSSDGERWDPKACAGDEHCYAGNCVGDYCVKGQIGCNGTIRATCRADGSGWEAGGVDCGAAGQTCFMGECHDAVCTPDTVFCDNGDIYQCNNSGTAARFYSTCSGDYHCGLGMYGAECLLNACAQGLPACDGARATTCNEDGSDYLPGGTLCPAYCAGGSCTNEYFREDFESSLSRWTPLNPDVQATLVSTTSAASSAQSLQLTRQGSTSGPAMEISFGELKPSAISWWASVGVANASSATIQFFGESRSEPVITHGFFTAGSAVHYSSSLLYGTMNYLADTWYHFEIRDLDWVNRRFSYYVDGMQRSAAVGMSQGFGIARIVLECGNAQTTCRFDQIEFTP